MAPRPRRKPRRGSLGSSWPCISLPCQAKEAPAEEPKKEEEEKKDAEEEEDESGTLIFSTVLHEKCMGLVKTHRAKGGILGTTIQHQQDGCCFVTTASTVATALLRLDLLVRADQREGSACMKKKASAAAANPRPKTPHQKTAGLTSPLQVKQKETACLLTSQVMFRGRHELLGLVKPVAQVDARRGRHRLACAASGLAWYVENDNNFAELGALNRETDGTFSPLHRRLRPLQSLNGSGLCRA